MMKLYGYFRSSAAYRVRIALNLKQLKYEYIAINLRKGEQSESAWLAMNPQGLVPLLETPKGEKITQSIAILEWLEETHLERPLLPNTLSGRVRVRSLMGQIASDIHPLNNLRVLKYLENTLHLSSEDKLKWYQHWVDIGFTALEQQLTDEKYCYGEEVTLADVCLISQVYNALRFNVGMTPYPKIQAIYEECMSLNEFAKAMPEEQPDAV